MLKKGMSDLKFKYNKTIKSKIAMYSQIISIHSAQATSIHSFILNILITGDGCT